MIVPTQRENIAVYNFFFKYQNTFIFQVTFLVIKFMYLTLHYNYTDSPLVYCVTGNYLGLVFTSLVLKYVGSKFIGFDIIHLLQLVPCSN